ncbi:MAG: LegC family aminotransferase [Syntrophomonadaceae bacterium]|nr:LegC family aminotransferase [Syntrophomonadaceae bacterium]
MNNRLDLVPIIDTLRTVLPANADMISLHEPRFCGNEWMYVKECLDSGWVSSAGSFVNTFEEKLAEYTGVKYVIAVANGTAALHLSLVLAGVSAFDEVIVPAMTFIATANAVSYCGAVPHLADCEEKTLGLDPYKLSDYLDEISETRINGCYNKKNGRRIKAVIPVHTFGHPADMQPLAELCQRKGLELIEDAAGALGSFYCGKHTGSWGKLSILSFNGNKIITTGGGGAILTNDEPICKAARHMSTQAKLPHQWSFRHDQTGYNYRMPNLNAALGCAQLETLPDLIRQKRALAARYQAIFADIEGISIFKEANCSHSNYWLNVLLLDEKYEWQRDELLALTNNHGIMTRPAWTLLHRQPMYQGCQHMDLSKAESLERRIINLPSSAWLGAGRSSDAAGR